MASKGAPKREAIVATIALAISYSKLKGLADKSTLEMVILGQYKELVNEDTLHLEVLWSLLKDLPGFEEKAAVEPFCLIKTWESEFGLEVELPEALASLNSAAILSAASKVDVPSRRKRATLFPEVAAEQAAASSKSSSKSKSSGKAKAKSSGDGGSSKGLIIMLVLVVLGGGGFTAYTMLSGDGNAVAISTIAPDLPISEATRQGAELTLHLSGDDWFLGPEEERKAGMEATLRSVTAVNIETVMVYDSVGNYRASARWFGSPPTIVVRLK